MKNMPVSRLDIFYRKILLSKFFTKGWGDPEHVLRLLKFRKIISKRETCYNLVDKDHPIEILKEETWSDCYVRNCRFKSPLAIHLPEVVHPEVQNAYFQMIVPKQWSTGPYRPICIHLAGTGDHYFWKRRQMMVKPLLKQGIASIILENPFYGTRKPKDQNRSCLLNVSDIFVMGGCLILECIAILHWCEKLGFGPMGVTGLSMGGHMASLAATSWPKPLVLVPCLSWSTASSVFTEGVMSEAIDWDFLQHQYFSNKQYHEIISKLCKIVDDPTEFGLAKIPELIVSDKSKLTANKSLTPHELLALIKDSTSDTTSHLLVSEESSKPLYSFIKSVLKQVTKDTTSIKIRDKDAIWFMRGLMDECTHLKNFATPVDTSLIIALCAQSDAYVPRDGCTRLEDIWPGATIKYLDCGHVGAYIKYLTLFRRSILQAFERAKSVYPPPKIPYEVRP
ncbi:PREDICTED: protein ABHD18 [Nicrophorus vespilloides]|uniref:Protein ABHD18 n=1 Tax=Nicrophorus vespilloides TaxID=110193 RepID=A0ABM1MJS5_NICVS|nr:PREDICTED: protein ABHD18 [Nicrophorus vespilloides]